VLRCMADQEFIESKEAMAIDGEKIRSEVQCVPLSGGRALVMLT
jgi:hypothetical protein